MSTAIDLAELRHWIGTEETAEDMLSAALAERFHATLSLDGTTPESNEIAARLIHFCLC